MLHHIHQGEFPCVFSYLAIDRFLILPQVFVFAVGHPKNSWCGGVTYRSLCGRRGGSSAERRNHSDSTSSPSEPTPREGWPRSSCRHTEHLEQHLCEGVRVSDG